MIRILFLLLFALPAWADTYYVKCDAATNGAGTFADPRNTFVGITTAAGDVFRLWPNVVCGADKAQGTDAIIEVLADDDGVTIELAPELNAAECDSSTGDGCWILDGENAIDIGLHVLNADTFLAKDGWIKNNTYHNFRHHGTQTQNFSFSLYRVRLQQAGPTNDNDSKYAVLTKGNCGHISRSTAGPFKTEVYTEYLTVDTCSRLGVDHRWWIVAKHHHYKGYRTGYDRIIGGHALSMHPLSTTFTSPSAFTYVSGTCPGSDCVHSMPVVTAADEEQLMWDRGISPTVRIERVADGNTNPPEGYFSVVSNATIYFNFGYTPTGTSLRINRQPIQVDCYDCEFAYNYVQADGDLEGTGFHADDTAPGRCFRCYSHDNEGGGFFFNGSTTDYNGLSPRCEACIAVNNGKAACTGSTCGKGIYVSGGDADIVNSVSVGSKLENFAVAGRHNQCGDLINLVSMNAGTIGLRHQHDALDDCTPIAVYSWNDATAFSGTGATGTIANPQFLGGPNPTTVYGFRVAPTSPLCAAGIVTATKYDYDGKRLNTPPDIGAFKCAPAASSINPLIPFPQSNIR